MAEDCQNVRLGVLNTVARISDTDFQYQHWGLGRIDGKYNSIISSCLDAIQSLEDHGFLDIIENPDASNCFIDVFSKKLFSNLQELAIKVSFFKGYHKTPAELLDDKKWQEIVLLAGLIKPTLEKELSIKEEDEYFL